jgi:cell shape-determining protein MreD
VLGLQLGLGDVVAWGAAGPELALAAAAWLGLRARAAPAVLGALILGLGRDLIGDGPPGVHAVSFAAATLLVRLLGQDLAAGSPIVAALAGLVAAVTASLANLGILALNDAATAPSARAAIASIIWTSLLTPLLIAAMDRYRKHFGFKRSSFEKR